MGVDAMIFFRATEPFELERELPNGYEIVGNPEFGPDEATHQIYTLERYYGPHYERGSWPNICAVLMLLHACKNVEKVWYNGDSSDHQECPPEKVLEISAHFMKVGERPYREYFK